MKSLEYIKEFCKTLTTKAGVYRYINADGEIMYVGKAKNLKNRVTSYTNVGALSRRIGSMISQVVKIEITITANEAEALLLESSLIKQLKPKYNILLKDDKSFPYIKIDSSDYPRITKFRGKKVKGDVMFGPFPSAGAVEGAISALTKAFQLRTCTDSYFKSRTRPCLEYEMKRCSAPCVDKVSAIEYNEQVAQAVSFLEGKDKSFKQELGKQMQEAADNMEYERAGGLRDKLRALNQISGEFAINVENIKEADLIAYHEGCIQVFFVRGGKILGDRPYFPKNIEELSSMEVLEAFIGRFYTNKVPPAKLYLSDDIYTKDVLEEALEKLKQAPVKIEIPKRGEKRAIMETVLENAKESVNKKLQTTQSNRAYMKKLAELINYDGALERIEVYDNSHIFGKNAYGAMVVAGVEGFEPAEYRTFKVDSGEKITGGDDFYMMRQVFERRFKKTDNLPSLVLIDGGKGQISAVADILIKCGVPYVGIAKGENRNAGEETLLIPAASSPRRRGSPEEIKEEIPAFAGMTKQSFMEIKLPKSSALLHYLQRLRDEAHRFAITTHRKSRSRAIRKSELDEIPNIGASRKRALLQCFASINAIKEASVSELMEAEGINKSIAQAIHDWFN